MTEIQWLCDVLLNFKLPSPVKDRFIARIGEVEALLIPRSSNGRTSSFGLENGGSIPSRGTIQAPSTQRILDEMAQSPEPVATRQIMARMPVPVEKIDKETGRAMVATGKGTSGPRKF